MRGGFWIFILYVVLVAFAALGSVLSALLGVDPGSIAPVTAVLIVLTGTWCVGRQITSAAAIAWVMAVGAVSEIAGLYTGIPFGRYEYTALWWPTVPLPGDHRFPLMLPLAWTMIAGGSFLVARQWLRPASAALAGALLATLVDFPMEHAMTEVHGYWNWQDPVPALSAPLSNSVGWFLVSWVACAAVARLSPEPPRGALQNVVLALFCLFTALSILLHEPHPSAAVLVLLALVLIGMRRGSVRNSFREAP
jgi:uncharacterized membrane protein